MEFNETAKAIGFRDGDVLISADGVPFEQGKPRVEEQTKLFDPCLEKTGEEEVPSLMNDNEQRKAHNELQGTNQKCFHLIIFLFYY